MRKKEAFTEAEIFIVKNPQSVYNREGRPPKEKSAGVKGSGVIFLEVRMGKLKGQKEYKKFLDGGSLSPKQAILAQCFVCNGEEEGSNENCQGKTCPLYPFFRKWLFKGRKSNVEAESATFALHQNKEKGVYEA